MNRVQKKCLIASTGLHGLLLVVVLFGSAFFTAKDKLDISPPLEFIHLDAKLIDGLTTGGGNPTAKTAPPAPSPAPPVPPKPDVVSTPAVVTKPEPVKPVKPEPVPPKPKPEPVVKEPIKHEHGLEPVPKVTKKKEIKIDPSKLVVRKSEDTKARDDAAKKKAQQDKEAREYADAQRQAQAANAARFKGALNNLKNNLSSSTSVEQFGPGGEAFVGYSQFVRKVYDEAWIAPGDGADDSATVQVEVTIARSGNVVSANIKKRSGSVVLDNSIDRVLKRVSFVAPFPEGAKDAQRTFVINFNLKAKRLSG